jgi:two-component system response regulator HydG
MSNYAPDILTANFAQLLLESMADGVFTLDRNGIITSWNPSMERITGYKANEAVGKNCMMLSFNRCVGRKCPAGFHECGIFIKGAVDGKECMLRHKLGYDVPVLKSARLVKDDQGDIRGIVETVTDISELKRARQAIESANLRLGEVHRMENIIGKSRNMIKVFESVRAAAASEATILIQGESGTGKELVAGAIHYNSHRVEKPFVAVSCSALAESLLESELFGHAKGSFTGALRDRMGRFEEADGGSIFLDEIGEISPYIQVKLLRVLQEREVERVGESKRRKINIRVITASNKDLYELVRKGEFREDLYYRLKVFPINVPPIRERKEDIALLVSHFIDLQNKKTGKRIQGVSEAAMRIMLDHDWPGNVRELENAIEHAFVICSGTEIDSFDLPVEVRQMRYQSILPSGLQVGRKTNRRNLSRELLLALLEECDWNKAEVARRIGLSRTAVWKYMKKWNIPLQPEE